MLAMLHCKLSRLDFGGILKAWEGFCGGFGKDWDVVVFGEFGVVLGCFFVGAVL